MVTNKKHLKQMKSEATTIIHLASTATGATGMSPIPGSDAPIIATIQSTMIYKLNSAFNVNASQSMMISTVTNILGMTVVAQCGKMVVANFLKLLPIGGTLLGGLISGSTAIAITEAIGFAYVKLLENYYNPESGAVEFPENVEEVLSYFKLVFEGSR